MFIVAPVNHIIPGNEHVLDIYYVGNILNSDKLKPKITMKLNYCYYQVLCLYSGYHIRLVFTD